MKIAGQSVLNAPADSIWPLIFDPRSLLQLLPGCEAIEQVTPDSYRGRLVLHIPAVSGSYDLHVRVLRSDPPRSCEIAGEATGANGSVKGRAGFTLTPAGQETQIDYQGEAQIAGPLGSMNSRFAEGVAQTLIRQGLSRLPELARARTAAEESNALPAGKAAQGRPATLRDRLRRMVAGLRRAWRRGPDGAERA